MDTHSRLQRIYYGIKSRCYNSNYRQFYLYGGKGITMCDEWKNNPNSFYEWALNHGYSDDLTIDRIDNSKGYFAENCRWVSYKTQANNTSRNHFVTFNGKTQTISQWSEKLGIPYHRLKDRLRKGWPIEEALGFVKHDNKTLKLIYYKGENKSLADWCRDLNLPYVVIKSRLSTYHWSVEKTFETPVRKRNR